MEKQKIGIKLADGTFYPILNDGVPDVQTLELTTVRDDQTTVQLDLYRSSSDLMQDAEYVDTLLIENLLPRPKETPSLALKISLDEENVLSAEIEDSESGEHSETKVSLVTLDSSERTQYPDFTMLDAENADNDSNDSLLDEFADNTVAEQEAEMSSENEKDQLDDLNLDDFGDVDSLLADNSDTLADISEPVESANSTDELADDLKMDDIIPEDVSSEEKIDDNSDMNFDMDSLPDFDNSEANVIEEPVESIEEPVEENIIEEPIEESIEDAINEEPVAQETSEDDLGSMDFPDIELPVDSKEDDLSSLDDFPNMDDFDSSNEVTDTKEENAIVEDAITEEPSTEEPAMEEPVFDTDSAFDTEPVFDEPVQETVEENEIADMSFPTEEKANDEDILKDSILGDDDFSSTTTESESNDLPDFDDSEFSTPKIENESFPDFNEIAPSNDDDFSSKIDTSQDLDDSIPGPDFSFSDLYDKETISGESCPPNKKCSIPVLVCIICAVISVLALLGILLLSPLQLSKKGDNKDGLFADDNTPVEQIVETQEETIVEDKDAAKEDEIVIVETPIVAPVETEVVKEDIKIVQYKVKWGDTLWDIASTYYKNPWLYRFIAEYNHLENPDYIISGTVLDIPPR